MDKYEFNIKVEQIKKMVKVGDYAGAMKTADEIDWRRVSSVSLLTLVSEVYEKNRDYSEAKEILILAYEKAPIGKRLLYKLTMLALNEGNIPEAEAYYREFYDLAPDDSRQHILRYLILKAKGAPADQLINSLEQYTRDELDERWMYELAELYHQAGRSEDCVAMCDRVMLMFGIGKYVDKAMDLKLNREGRPLNEYQQNLIDNRDMYEARLKEMDEHPDKYDPDADAVVVEKPENYEHDNMVSDDTADLYTTLRHIPDTRPYMQPEEPSAVEVAEDKAIESIAEPVKEPVEAPARGPIVDDGGDEIVKADLGAILGGAYMSAKADAEETVTVERAPMAEEPEETAAVAAAIAATVTEGTAETTDPEVTENNQAEKEDEEMTIYTVNFIVERRKEEDGVNAAIRLLKLMHEHTGSHNQVSKIKAGKLNTLGVLASRDKLAGKDLVIEQAGDLAYSIIEEVMELIKTEPTERVVVLIDNPMQIRKMLSAYPELLQLFHVDKEEDSVTAEQEEVPKKAAAQEPAYEDDYEPAPAPAPIKTQAGGMTMTSAEREMQAKMSEEMDIDEFVDYAQEYAESIDCSISGKSKLAIYERGELMEEDGIKLTRENAVALIEEAADKAEKKGLGSLFKAKYDKEDKLILREEHFVD